MIEARLDPCLAQEPLVFVLADRRALEPLDRHVAPDAPIVCEHDLPHPATTDDLAEHVHAVDARFFDEILVGGAGLQTPAHEGVGLALLIHHDDIVQRSP